MEFRAGILEIDDPVYPIGIEDSFQSCMKHILNTIGYELVFYKKIDYNESDVKKEVAALVDDKRVTLVFVRNRGMYSLNEALFDLEDRSFRDVESWRRSWSRQRILYNETNHAITLVRDKAMVMNFEGEFTGVSKELIEILSMWKANSAKEEESSL